MTLLLKLHLWSSKRLQKASSCCPSVLLILLVLVIRFLHIPLVVAVSISEDDQLFLGRSTSIPSFTEEPVSHITHDINNKDKLFPNSRCTASGNAHVRWMYWDMPLTGQQGCETLKCAHNVMDLLRDKPEFASYLSEQQYVGESTLTLLATIMNTYTTDLSRKTYFCAANNSAGLILSRSMTIQFVSELIVGQGVLAVIDNPVIHQGQTAVFTCKINPINNRAYYKLDRWVVYSNSNQSISKPMRELVQSDGNYSVISDVENPELHVRNVQSEDFRHSFECIFRGLVGKPISSGRQHISETSNAPSNNAMFSPGNLHITVEATHQRTTVELPCVASPNPLRYIWYRINTNNAINGQRNQYVIESLSASDEVKLVVAGNNHNDVKYTWVSQGHGNILINHLTPKDSGAYKCVAEYGTNNRLFVRVNLKVYAKLGASVTPTDQSKKYLSSVQFKCDVAGAPVSSVTWLHNGLPLKFSSTTSSDRINILNQDRSSVLNIQQLTLEDRGAYQCMVVRRGSTTFAGQLHQVPADNAQAASGLTLSSMPPALRASSQPTIIQVREGETHVMWCDFAAEPPPSLIWKLDGLNISDKARLSNSNKPGVIDLSHGVKRAILTHTFDSIYHTGLFSVVAKNSFGESWCNFTVVMLQSKLIIRPIEKVQAVDSQPLRLACYVLGGFNSGISLVNRASTLPSTSMYSIVWHFKSKPYSTPLKLPRDHRMHLDEKTGQNEVVISSVIMGDAGNYNCTAIRSTLSVTQNFSLEVVRAPVARPLVNSTLDPERQNRLTETCTYENDADPPVLAWWSRVLDNQMLEIILRPDRNNKKLVVGYSAKNVGDANLSLRKDMKEKLPSFMQENDFWRDYVGLSASLSVFGVESKDAGKYICNVINPYGLATSVKYVKFTKNYEFQEGEPPNQKDVILGQRVTVNCVIRHDNKSEIPLLNWWLRVSNLPQTVARVSLNDSYRQKNLPEVYQVSERPGQTRLVIQNLQLEHKNFLCVTEGISNTKSAAFNPNIKLPALVQPFANSTVEVVASSNQQFECLVTGNSPYNITWYAKFDDFFSSTYGERRTAALGTDFCHLTPPDDSTNLPGSVWPNCRSFLLIFKELNIINNRLIIQTASTRWQGIFRCNASNEFNLLGGRGPSSSEFRLVVINRPDRVRDFMVDESQTTATSVYLKFRAPEKDGNKAIKNYLLEYYDLFNKLQKRLLMNNEFTVPIHNLQPGHLYSFKLFAINAVGHSEPVFCDVSTHETKPTGPVQLLQANATLYNKVLLYWRKPKLEHINSPEVRYALSYRQVGASPAVEQDLVQSFLCEEASDDAQWQPIGECNQLRSVIFNGTTNAQLCQFHSALRAFTKYQFRVLARNSKGFGPQACVTVRTLESAPKQPPSNVSCETASMSEIKLKWVAPEVTTINGVITSYQVQVLLASKKMYWDESGLLEKDTAATEFLMDSLKPYTNYSFTVTVSNSRGRSAPSSPIFCRTQATAPDPPSLLKLKQSSKDCFMASWVHPANSNGAMKGYTLRLLRNLAVSEVQPTNPINRSVNVKEEFVQVDLNQTYQMHRLCTDERLFQGMVEPGVEYLLQIRSRNHLMDSREWSEPASVVATTFEQLQPAIVTFSREVHVSDDSSVSLDCVVVGLKGNSEGSLASAPTPDQVFWEPRPGSQPAVQKMKTQLSENFALVLSRVPANGQYTCRLYNGEQITYTLLVAKLHRARPNPPQLLAGSLTNSSLEVKWRTNGFQELTARQGQRGGFDPNLRILEFRVNFTNYFNGSHTESRKLDSSKRSYLIDPVSCGTLYGFSIAASNKYGWSLWSPEKKLRTKGSAPIPPQDIKFVVGPKAHLHSAQFNFSGVEPGDGCAVSVFLIFYHNTQNGREMQLDNAKSVSVPTTELHQGCCYILQNLNAATHYVYRVVAINAAGNTTFDGYFFTTTKQGNRPSDPQLSRDTYNTISFFANPTVLIPSILVGIIICLLAVGLFLFVRRHCMEQTIAQHREVTMNQGNDELETKPFPQTRALPNQPLHTVNAQNLIVNPWGAYGKSNDEVSQRMEILDDDDDDVNSETGSVDSKGNINPYATFPYGPNQCVNGKVLETDRAPRDLGYCREEQSQLKRRMHRPNHRSKTGNSRRNPSTANYENPEIQRLTILRRDNSLDELEIQTGSAPPYSKGYSSGYSSGQGTSGGGMSSGSNVRTTVAVGVGRPTNFSGGPHQYYDGVKYGTGAQTDRLVAQRASQLSSITTVSSNHDELSDAYSYGQRYRLPLTEYEDSQHTSGSSETTDSGIRRFTQEPPQPEEQRHATCEVPLYGAGRYGQNQARRMPQRQDSINSEMYESVDACTLTNASRYGGSSGRSTLGRHPMPAPPSKRFFASGSRTRTYSEAGSYGTGVYESAEAPYYASSRNDEASTFYGSNYQRAPAMTTAARNRDYHIAEQQALMSSSVGATCLAVNARQRSGMRSPPAEHDDEVSEMLINRQYRTLPHLSTPRSSRPNRVNIGDGHNNGRRQSQGGVLHNRAERLSDGEIAEYDMDNFTEV